MEICSNTSNKRLPICLNPTLLLNIAQFRTGDKLVVQSHQQNIKP